MEDSIKSKTELKKEAEAIQDLGIKISELSDSLIENLSLPKSVIDAIFDYKKIKKNSAKRRQAQYIGKLMRDIDLEAVRHEVSLIENHSRINVEIEHKAEKLRELLLVSDQEKTKFFDSYQVKPDFNLTLINARREVSQNKRGKNYRNLFRMIKEILN
jgi:ribosome-associated protein